MLGVALCMFGVGIRVLGLESHGYIASVYGRKLHRQQTSALRGILIVRHVVFSAYILYTGFCNVTDVTFSVVFFFLFNAFILSLSYSPASSHWLKFTVKWGALLHPLQNGGPPYSSSGQRLLVDLRKVAN